MYLRTQISDCIVKCLFSSSLVPSFLGHRSSHCLRCQHTAKTLGASSYILPQRHLTSTHTREPSSLTALWKAHFPLHLLHLSMGTGAATASGIHHTAKALVFPLLSKPSVSSSTRICPDHTAPRSLLSWTQACISNPDNIPVWRCPASSPLKRRQSLSPTLCITHIPKQGCPELPDIFFVKRTFGSLQSTPLLRNLVLAHLNNKQNAIPRHRY